MREFYKTIENRENLHFRNPAKINMPAVAGCCQQLENLEYVLKASIGYIYIKLPSIEALYRGKKNKKKTQPMIKSSVR